MLELMYDVPNDKNISKVIINEDCITQNASPIIIRTTEEMPKVVNE